MRYVVWLLPIVAAFGVDGAAVGSGQRPAPPTPIVVELFTSEGCSDCPPADAVLEKLMTHPVAGAEVIALGEHVDYWDQLGWRDRFSSAALTQRQQVYGVRFNLDSVYTPQMVVDGRLQFVGSDARSAAQAVERAVAAPHASVRVAIGRPTPLGIGIVVDIGGLPASGGDRADVIVAVTEDRLRSNVTRGENRGRTLSHAAVVRSMTTIGQAAAGPSQLRADIPIASEWNRDALKMAVFVQETRGRAILGAAAAPVGAPRP